MYNFFLCALLSLHIVARAANIPAVLTDRTYYPVSSGSTRMGPGSIVISPDIPGKPSHVYAVLEFNNSIARWTRDPSTGKLSDETKHVVPYKRPFALAILNDGSKLFLATRSYKFTGQGALIMFSRNIETGTLTFQQRLRIGTGQYKAFGDESVVGDFTVSPDGKFFYIQTIQSYYSGGGDGGVFKFDVNILKTTPEDNCRISNKDNTECWSPEWMHLPGIPQYQGYANMVFSPNGKQVFFGTRVFTVNGKRYGAANSIMAYTRDATTGMILPDSVVVYSGEQVAVDHVNNMMLAISTNGKHIYSYGSSTTCLNNLFIFDRDPGTGILANRREIPLLVGGKCSNGNANYDVVSIGMTEDSTSLYLVARGSAGNGAGLLAFDIDPLTGDPLPMYDAKRQRLPGSPCLTESYGVYPHHIAIHPSGKDIYLSTMNTPHLTSFTRQKKQGAAWPAVEDYWPSWYRIKIGDAWCSTGEPRCGNMLPTCNKAVGPGTADNSQSNNSPSPNSSVHSSPSSAESWPVYYGNSPSYSSSNESGDDVGLGIVLACLGFVGAGILVFFLYNMYIQKGKEKLPPPSSNAVTKGIELGGAGAVAAGQSTQHVINPLEKLSTQVTIDTSNQITAEEEEERRQNRARAKSLSSYSSYKSKRGGADEKKKKKHFGQTRTQE